MKRKLKNIIALGIGIFISLLIVELFLNIYNPFKFYQKGDNIVLPANFKLSFENKKITGLDSIINYSRNSLGFRGPEKPIDFESQTSIIAVGGSTTECLYISDGKDWVSLLGNKLNKLIDNVWMNNAGLDGHSTFGHQILLKDHLVRLKPNYIIFLVGCNDVERDDLGKYDKLNLKSGNNWKNYIRNNSELVSLIVNLRRTMNAKNKGLKHSGLDFNNINYVDSIPYDEINKMIFHQKEVYAPDYKKRLKDLIDITKNNNIIPVFVTQPSLLGKGVDQPTSIDLERIIHCDDMGGKAYWEKLEMYNDVTRNLAKKENVLLIDLARKMPKSTSLFYDCVHYTNAGAEVVSQILYDGLKHTIKTDL